MARSVLAKPGSFKALNRIALDVYRAEIGRWSVDELGVDYGRDALKAAAHAAARAAHFHARAVMAPDRLALQRRLLITCIKASDRLAKEFPVASSAQLAEGWATEARAAYKALDVVRTVAPHASVRRPVQDAAREAAAKVWEAATGRQRLKRSPKDPNHPLERLLKAVAKDLSDGTWTLSCEQFRRDRA
jgi:hypothetical protein